MNVLESRLLRGPSVYARAPCCAALLERETGDVADTTTLVARLRHAWPSIGAIDDASSDAAAWLVVRLATALQRAVGSDVDFVAVVPSTTVASQVRVAFAYAIEALAERVLAVAVDLVACGAAGDVIDIAATLPGLRAIVDAHAVDAATTAWLAAARRRGIPVLRLDEDARRFQLGWGSRQRHVEAGRATEPPSALPDLDAWFASPDDGRIPTVAVTGTNGKTTTTLLIAHVARAAGARVGTTTTSGIFIDGRVVERGDCTGYWSARKVLTSPDVDVATLETARGGLLKRGLAFDRCDVGIVLNVSSDHLGLDGIETLDDLAHAKGLVARCATKAAVLNAEDPRCVAMAATLVDGCEAVFFSMDPDHPVVRAHVAAGGRAAVLEQGSLTWRDGDARYALVAPERLPFALHGLARHNVANALAALAAALCMGYDAATIAAAFEGFVSDAKQNPLRTNRFEIDGATLLVDYAHNVVAYRALCETARALIDGRRGRLIGVVTSPGDRRAADLRDVGRVCGEYFDELFVYEQDPRGRAAGQTVEAILAGSRTAAGDKPLHGIPPIRDALAGALATSRPGDVVVFTCAGTLDDLVEGVRRTAPDAASAIAEAVGLPA